jgi:DNA invertase Pin-like site-specific DNA recombinase
MSTAMLASPKRCAVYCRVSSDERLDQSFNSIDAQKEAGHAFIKSQTHEGWIAVSDDYDDGGFSGGNMERPGLRRLMTDIEAGRIDIVVVYKIDRLSRSLADFARMVEVFDRCGVSFSAVTQQINSATSMGRLMLNVLLSFAQFEREVTGERIRDKIAASKAKGMWMGGPLPLGYDVRNRLLVVNEADDTDSHGQERPLLPLLHAGQGPALRGGRLQLRQPAGRIHRGAGGRAGLPGAARTGKRAGSLDRVRASAIDLDEARVVMPMRQLATVWPSLFPAEQRRLAQLLIERVLIGDEGLEILWRDAGWVELIEELRPGSVGAELAEVEMNGFGLATTRRANREKRLGWPDNGPIRRIRARWHPQGKRPEPRATRGFA